MNRTLVNGSFAQSLSVYDRGLAYGDGVFETVRLWKGEMPFWAQHFSRLRQGLDRLLIVYPTDLESRLIGYANQLLGKNKDFCQSSAVLKIMVTRGEGGRGYSPLGCEQSNIIMVLNSNPYQFSIEDDGCHLDSPFSLMHCVHILSSNKRLAGIKHLNRLDQVLASAELLPGYDEGLLCDGDGNVIEGTKTNLVLVKSGKWHTPDLAFSGVQGVMLSTFTQWLESKGQRLNVSKISKNSLKDVDHLFVMNSVLGIKHVSLFDGKRYQSPGIYKEIQSWLSDEYGYNK